MLQPSRSSKVNYIFIMWIWEQNMPPTFSKTSKVSLLIIITFEMEDHFIKPQHLWWWIFILWFIKLHILTTCIYAISKKFKWPKRSLVIEWKMQNHQLQVFSFPIFVVYICKYVLFKYLVYLYICLSCFFYLKKNSFIFVFPCWSIFFSLVSYSLA